MAGAASALRPPLIGIPSRLNGTLLPSEAAGSPPAPNWRPPGGLLSRWGPYPRPEPRVLVGHGLRVHPRTAARRRPIRWASSGLPQKHQPKRRPRRYEVILMFPLVISNKPRGTGIAAPSPSQSPCRQLDSREPVRQASFGQLAHWSPRHCLGRRRSQAFRPGPGFSRCDDAGCNRDR